MIHPWPPKSRSAARHCRPLRMRMDVIGSTGSQLGNIASWSPPSRVCDAGLLCAKRGRHHRQTHRPGTSLQRAEVVAQHPPRRLERTVLAISGCQRRRDRTASTGYRHRQGSGPGGVRPRTRPECATELGDRQWQTHPQSNGEPGCWRGRLRRQVARDSRHTSVYVAVEVIRYSVPDSGILNVTCSPYTTTARCCANSLNSYTEPGCRSLT